MKVYDLDNEEHMSELVNDFFNQHVAVSGGPTITPDMTYREQCITEFLWVDEQEKIAEAMVEGIRYRTGGGKIH